MTSTNSLRWLNLLGLVIALVLNSLANGLPLNGKTTGELSDMYPNLFVPAGFTFGIWALIYLMLIGVVIVQFRSSSAPWVKRIGLWFFISCLANASWIVAWHYLQVRLSLLIMLLILGSLLLIFLRLRTVAAADGIERWLVRPAFSVYLGWISVATVANVTTLLVDEGFDGGALSPVVW
ncbi:MAG: tryptophan-rich sensory protein, partial [Bacteroidetes bacterium]